MGVGLPPGGFAPLNDVRAYSTMVLKNNPIREFLDEHDTPPWHSSAPPPPKDIYLAVIVWFQWGKNVQFVYSMAVILCRLWFSMVTVIFWWILGLRMISIFTWWVRKICCLYSVLFLCRAACMPDVCTKTKVVKLSAPLGAELNIQNILIHTNHGACRITLWYHMFIMFIDKLIT